MVVGGPDDQLAADQFPLAAGVIGGLGRRKGGRPTTTALVALFQIGVAEGVGPVGDRKHHDARFSLIVVVHVAQGALWFGRQREGPIKRRFKKIAQNLAQHLRFGREEKAFVPVYKTSLIFQHDQRLGHPHRDDRVAVVHAATQNRSPTLFVFNRGGRRIVGLGETHPGWSQQQSHQQQASP